MKRTHFLIAISVLMMSMASCQKEEDTIQDSTPEPAPTPTIGHFAISPTRQVILSPGNVQYCPATKEWRFAPHQYDIVGESNLQSNDIYEGWVDLFQWGSGSCPTLYTDDLEPFSSFHDWGENFEGGWRTLDETEADYLLLKRPKHDNLCVPATVCGITGLVLLPDDWDGPALQPMGWSSRYESNTYDADSWRAMEMKGAIFLPAAGGIDGDEMVYAQIKGHYWVKCAPPTPTYSFVRSFTFDATSITEQAARFVLRRSVRLAKDVE